MTGPKKEHILTDEAELEGESRWQTWEAFGAEEPEGGRDETYSAVFKLRVAMEEQMWTLFKKEEQCYFVCISFCLSIYLSISHLYIFIFLDTSFDSLPHILTAYNMILVDYLMCTIHWTICVNFLQKFNELPVEAALLIKSVLVVECVGWKHQNTQGSWWPGIKLS